MYFKQHYFELYMCIYVIINCISKTKNLFFVNLGLVTMISFLFIIFNQIEKCFKNDAIKIDSFRVSHLSNLMNSTFYLEFRFHKRPLLNCSIELLEVNKEHSSNKNETLFPFLFFKIPRKTFISFEIRIEFHSNYY